MAIILVLFGAANIGLGLMPDNDIWLLNCLVGGFVFGQGLAMLASRY